MMTTAKNHGRATYHISAFAKMLGMVASMVCALLIGIPVYANVPPSFTFTADIPTQVVAGTNFTITASITDIGGPAVDYNSYFQIYNSSFQELSQTYFTGQTFTGGQTLDYTVPLTAPSDPGQYYVAALMFNQDYTSGIVSQEFFVPPFDVVAAAPEPESILGIGVMLAGVFGLCFYARLKCAFRQN